MAGHEPKSQTRKGPIHSSPMDQSNPPSPIEELKSQFGQLLLSEKDGSEIRTGSFPFLTLPRELRDRVYFHYLYRPKGVMYKRCKDSPGRFPFEDSEFVCLFLTSKQIYEESLGIFCRYNSVEVIWTGAYKIYSLPGTLRLFPDKSARILQRVSRSYSEWSPLCYPEDSCEGRGLGRHWIDMAAEAHLFKEYFPALREFTVRWFVGPRVFKEMDQLEFEDKSSEEKLEVWLEWMREWAKKFKVVPVPWMKFEFHSHYQANEMGKHQKELNDANDILVRELGDQPGRQELGRKWLEEVWGDGLKANRIQDAKLIGSKKGKRRDGGQA